MGQKTSVFAPYFLPFSQMTLGFGQMKKEKSEDKADEKNACPLFYICPFLRTEQKNDQYHSFSTQRIKWVFFCVHIQKLYTKKGVNMKTITTEELRNMSHQEGLILQRCGGDLQEWIDGINGILREQGILLDGEPLGNVVVFQHEGLTN